MRSSSLLSSACCPHASRAPSAALLPAATRPVSPETMVGFVFYGLCPPCASSASGLRASPLASQSFQVWAHLLLLNIPENSSPTSQAFSCIFLRQQSLWPSAIPRSLQGLRGTILNADFYYYYFLCCILRIEATRKWVKHILASTRV